MKWLKYIFMFLVLSALSINVYQNFIFYQIPYNPLSDLPKEDPNEYYISRFYFDKDDVDEAMQYQRTEEKENCKKAFEYFKNLKLIPVKDSEKIYQMEREGDFDLNYNLSFEQNMKSPHYLHIKEIGVDDIKFLEIRCDYKGFYDGYYKITNKNEKLNQEYLESLIN